MSNNPIKLNDPTGHKCVGDEDGCIPGEGGTGPTKPIQPPPPAGKYHDDDDYDPNPDCISCQLPEPVSPASVPSYQGYSNPEIDALYVYWQIMVAPVNEIISMDDIYRMSSHRGWKASRYSLNLGVLEAIVQGSRQAYRDSWYQSLTPTQRFLRPAVVGTEAYFTDAISGLVGTGYAAAGMTVGGPLGAAGGKAAGSTYATQVMDRFWMEKWNPSVFDSLGAWP